MATHAGGRPSKYEDGFADQAYKLCLLGATDKELADFFEVDETTIYEWKNKQEEFSQALKKGKDVADSTVAQKLFHRATGYEHEAVKIFADTKSGMVTQVDYTEHYPPDTGAAIFWLKNRQRGKWRDRIDTDITTKDESINASVLGGSAVDAFVTHMKHDTSAIQTSTD